MTSDADSSDSEYTSLPQSLKARIDSAFDSVYAHSGHNGAASSSEPRIHISHVPDALLFLNLPSDDDQILSVCRKAARRGMLGRKEWRRVCAVLLGGDEDAEEGGESMDVDAPMIEDEAMGEEGGFVLDQPVSTRIRRSVADPYAGAGGFFAGDLSGGFIAEPAEYIDDDNDNGGGGFLESSPSDSDEYVEPSSSKKKSSKKRTRRSSPPSNSRTPTTRRKRARTTAAAASSESDSESDLTGSGKPLTSSQKQRSLHVFSLFVSDDGVEGDVDLGKKRIMIRDVQRVAKLLGEKLKADEIVEMLEMFSSSPDKSVGLEDFQKIMVATKLL